MTIALAPPFFQGLAVKRADADVDTLLFWHVQSSAPPPAEGRFITLVPGTDAIVLTVSLPSTLKGRAREEVAIRQVCDRLNSKPESLRVLPMSLSGTRDSWSSVLVARADAITEWQRRLGASDARCRAILPDYLALPSAPGLWTIAASSPVDGTLVHVRLGPTDGFTAEAELAAFALMRALSTRPSPEAVLCLDTLEPEIEAALVGLNLVKSLQALPENQAAAGVLEHHEEVLDLRPHSKRRGTTALPTQVRNLRWPVVLIALGIIAWWASIELETQRYRAETQAIKEEVLEVVRRDFLPSGPIVDIGIQVEREMERLRSHAESSRKDVELLERFRQISHVLATQDDIEIVSAVLREGEGISLNLSAPNFATLDRITARLRETEGELRMLGSTTEAGGRVGGNLFIPVRTVDE